jgi:hypothetical protein
MEAFMNGHRGLFQFEMPERDWDSCVQLFRPYAARVFGIVEDGIRDYGNGTNEFFRGRVESKDRGSCTTSLIWARGLEQFADDDGVRPDRTMCIRKFVIGNAIALRVKACDSNLLVMPGKSPQHDRWYNNEPIDGFPDHLIRLNAVYRLDGAADFHSLYLTWQVSTSRIGQSIRIRSDGLDESLPPQLPIPAGSPLPMIPITKRGGKRDEAREEGS